MRAEIHLGVVALGGEAVRVQLQRRQPGHLGHQARPRPQARQHCLPPQRER